VSSDGKPHDIGYAGTDVSISSADADADFADFQPGCQLAGYGSGTFGTDATYAAFSVFGAAVGVAAIVRRRSLIPQ